MAILASLIAAVVGGRFSVDLGRRWNEGGRRSPALLHWTISTAMFALASVMLLLGEVVGWSGPSFRTFYLFGAVLNVPWLALGSVLVNSHSRPVNVASGVAALVTGLLFVPAALSGSGLAIPGALLGLVWGGLLLQPNESVTRRASVLLMFVLGAIALVAVLGADLREALPPNGIPEGRELFSDPVRGLAVGANALGALIVILGALASALSMSWAHTSSDARDDFVGLLRRAPVEAIANVLFAGTAAAKEAGVAHLAGGNLLIALGVLVAAGSGGMFSFLGDTAGHAIGLGGGAAIMYAGFVRTTRPLEVIEVVG